MTVKTRKQTFARHCKYYHSIASKVLCKFVSLYVEISYFSCLRENKAWCTIRCIGVRCGAYMRKIVNRIRSQRFIAMQRDTLQRVNRINFYSCSAFDQSELQKILKPCALSVCLSVCLPTYLPIPTYLPTKLVFTDRDCWFCSLSSHY